MNSSKRLPRSFRRSQQGLSLVELMVALTIGLFLMGAVGIIYVNTATTSRGSTLESQMNEDAALALELLQQQIRLAGFSNVDASGNRLFPGQAIRGCDGDADATDVGSAFDDNDAAFSALACNDGGTRPDAFAVRYEASLLNSQAVNDAGVQRPGNCAHEGITAWNALAEGASSATPMLLADNRYYIKNDENNENAPTLYCQGRTGAGFGNETALIPNIEDMQVQYAVTAFPTVGDPLPHQVAGYANSTEATDETDASPAFPALEDLAIPVGTPAGINNWSRVAALRVCLLARSARPVPTGDNPIGSANADGTTATAGLGTYIDCNGVSRTATDRFVRRAYVTTIQLRNMRPGLPRDYEVGGNPWQYMYDN
ncbi:PilW family protein [Hydrogenophaga flava]|uniref:PilW family protein n=1 Tax=Hydrogenophaga flava TaxID=65657 RepID=UPI0009FFF955|nr:PilW family protein [Hydrogenophaga flava]